MTNNQSEFLPHILAAPIILFIYAILMTLYKLIMDIDEYYPLETIGGLFGFTLAVFIFSFIPATLTYFILQMVKKFEFKPLIHIMLMAFLGGFISVLVFVGLGFFSVTIRALL